jgi:hypothetical protein
MLLLNLPRGGLREFHWSTNAVFLIGQLHMLAILHWLNFYVKFSIERGENRVKFCLPFLPQPYTSVGKNSDIITPIRFSYDQMSKTSSK